MMPQYEQSLSVISYLGTTYFVIPRIKLCIEAIERDVMDFIIKIRQVSKVYENGNTEVTGPSSRISLDVKAWRILSESSVLLDQEKYVIINRGCIIYHHSKGDI